MKYCASFNPMLSVEQIADVMNRPLYRGVSKLKQLAYLKKGYKGKNDNGGRVCRMTTPAQYKNRPDPTCIPWGTLREDAPVYVPAPNRPAQAPALRFQA